MAFSFRPLAVALTAVLYGSLPAAAVTPDQGGALATVTALAAQLRPAERVAVLAGLQLPEDQAYTVAFLDQAVPGWKLLALKLRQLAVSEPQRQGPRHRAAARFARLSDQVRPPRVPLPAMAPLNGPRYRAAVTMLAGQGNLPWPGQPARTVRFTNRLMGHPGNQLNQVCDYLMAYYRHLGVAVEDQPFTWEGETYRNVIATLPGRSKETVILVDHIDVAANYEYSPEALKEITAYGLSPEAIAAIRATHQVGDAVPGADDNASATAVLMEAAHAFKGVKPAKTIKLLHLNGEEFPGDDFGARHYVARALATHEPISAVIVLDMIGVNRSKNRQFQISVGHHPASSWLADAALQASASLAKGYTPVLRSFDDPKSYLYNTDGVIFSAAGYPVILLNELVNYDDDLERLGYHDEFDRVELIDWPYAQAIGSVGLATALMAADPGTRFAPSGARPSELQGPDHRMAHFQIDVRYSPLYEAVEAAERRLGRPLTDQELRAAIEADRGPAGDTDAGQASIVRRVTTWFPEAPLPGVPVAAVMAEVRYLRARAALVGQP